MFTMLSRRSPIAFNLRRLAPFDSLSDRKDARPSAVLLTNRQRLEMAEKSTKID